MATNEQAGGRGAGQSSWGQSGTGGFQGGGSGSQQGGFQDVHRGSGYAGSGQGSQSGQSGPGSQGGSDINERQRSGNSMQMGQRGVQQGQQQGLQRRAGYPQSSSQDPWSQFAMLDAPLPGGGPFSLMRRMTQDMDR